MYWLIAAVVLVVLEMFIGTFYLLVIAAALASVGLTEWLFHTPIEFNLAMLAMLCAVGIAVAHTYQKKRAKRTQSTNQPLDVGQSVRIEHQLHSDMYQVQYRGSTWQAQLQDASDPSSGQTAYICGRQGNILHIRSQP